MTVCDGDRKVVEEAFALARGFVASHVFWAFSAWIAAAVLSTQPALAGIDAVALECGFVTYLIGRASTASAAASVGAAGTHLLALAVKAFGGAILCVRIEREVDALVVLARL